MTSPATTYHVVSRVTGASRFDITSKLLCETDDLSGAHDVYRMAVDIAKASPAATVTMYREQDGFLTIEPGCRFDSASWRADEAFRSITQMASGLSAAGQAVLGGAS